MISDRGGLKRYRSMPSCGQFVEWSPLTTLLNATASFDQGFDVWNILQQTSREPQKGHMYLLVVLNFLFNEMVEDTLGHCNADVLHLLVQWPGKSIRLNLSVGLETE